MKKQLWVPLIRPTIYHFRKSLLGAAGVWFALESLLAASIFLSPDEPMPMGYKGTFQAFSIVLSGLYFLGVALMFAILLSNRFYHRIHDKNVVGRGFDVIHPDEKE